MIVNATNLRMMFVGFSTLFQQARLGVEPTWSRVAMRVPSTTRTQEYGWLGEMPRVREWLGERVIQGLNTHGYAIRNRTFELTLGVDREDMEDDNLGVFSPVITEMGRAAASFPDELVWPLLPAGAVTPCYDGQYFFDTDHPVLDVNGQTYSVSNWQGGNGTPWFLIDDTRAMKPLIFQDREPFKFVAMDQPTDEVVFNQKRFRYGVDARCNAGFGLWQIAFGSRQELTAETYAAARVAMTSMKGDFARPLGLKPSLLVVPSTLEPQARTILKADRNAAGATNIWAGSAEMFMSPWLA